jgi:hypothetical protein
MSAALQQLIDFVKSASPVIWSTLVRQVYTYAVADILWAMMSVTCAVFLYKLAMKNKPQYDKDKKDDKFYAHWEVGIPLCFVGSAITTLIAFGLIVAAIMAFMNPYYYAITNIISAMPH